MRSRHRYDRLNHLLSGGLDRRWRRRAIRELRLTGAERLLDVCTGTGDLAIEAATHRAGAARTRRRDRLRGRDAAHRARQTEGRGSDRTSRPGPRRRHAPADSPTVALTPRPLPSAFGTSPIRWPDAGNCIGSSCPAGARPSSSSACRRCPWWPASMPGTSAPCCRESAGSSRGTRTPTTTCRRQCPSFPSGESFVTILRQAGFSSVRSRPAGPRRRLSLCRRARRRRRSAIA